ncbi:hypothetical protein [Paenibacillus alginolyticus]|uniref:Uncharacterized protein n=1 Tax=Paenibacillus alginolyticus TaxID=59839 RepID=A0ABT4GA12_9BACL|nr:hypothetical protein [Paenibacillus alginolyticus]MCY9693010.1 hypothetical protein [Paenibacillus alginolyticus]MEC0146135.1 hypothetical protein [Paenibacillus alginolyticus]
MDEIRTTEDLMEQLSNMNRENSVRQIFIPGKGEFTIVLQEEDPNGIATDVELISYLKQMMNESMGAYKVGRTKSTAELLKPLSPKDFSK